MTADAIPEWASTTLPAELHDLPFLKDATDLGMFKTRITAAAEHVGNSVRIPGPDAAAADWEAFDSKLQAKIPALIRADLDSPEGRQAILKRLGQPDTFTDYGAEGEGAWLAEVAFKAGLTKNQFSDLVKGVGEVNTIKAQTLTAAQEKAISDLKAEWGFGYEKNLERIQGLIQLTGAPDDLAQQIKDGQVPAATLKWLDSVAKQFSETAKFADDRNNPLALTPLEAEAQIQEVINNPDYWKDTPVGALLRKKMLELQASANKVRP